MGSEDVFAHVAGKVHERGEPGFGVGERGEDLFDFDTADTFARAGLADATGERDALLVFGQEASLVWRVGKEEEDDHGHGDGRQTLDEKEQAPVGELGMARCDAVSEGACEASRERCGRQENASAGTDLVSEVEERQEVGTAGGLVRFPSPISRVRPDLHSGPKGGLKESEEETQSNLPTIRLSRSLAGSDQTPAKSRISAENMRLELFPPEDLELKDNVGDVEDGQKVVVVVADELEILGHAGDFGISNVTAVEERQEV